MKKAVFVVFFLYAACLYAQENAMTHYVTDNLRLRENDNLSSPVKTTLPQYTALRIIEKGKTATIDGITSPWIKVESQTGYTGWCFSGYVKQIENNIAEEVALSLEKRSAGMPSGLSGVSFDTSPMSNVVSIDLIKASSGYYIQQGRRMPNQGHAPEILTLSVDGENVYIREIDILDKRKITRKEIQLQFNGETYAGGKSKLMIQNEKIKIIYLEYLLDRPWLDSFDYESPYTFAGNLNSPIPDAVHRLSSDYLKTFAGEYVFDSYKIISSDYSPFLIERMKDIRFRITYNQKAKHLTAPLYSLSNILSVNGGLCEFVDTTEAEPFYWYFGESLGYTEIRLCFYKGGIVCTYDYYREDELKYVVFLRKESTISP